MVKVQDHIVYFSLILTYVLTMRTSTAITTCTLYGNERRTNVEKAIKKVNKNCKSDGTCTEVHALASLTCIKGNKCTYVESVGKTKVHLTLGVIRSARIYKKIHNLECEDGDEDPTCHYKAKLRFDVNETSFDIDTFYSDFQEYVTNYDCSCYSCECKDNAYGCTECSEDKCFKYFCNCMYSSTSTLVAATTTANTVPNMTTDFPRSFEYINTTPSRLSSAKIDFSKTQPVTSTTGHSTDYTTSRIPLNNMNPTTTIAVSLSLAKTASQSNGDHIPTLAAVGGVIALVITLVSVAVFVCLRKKRRGKKPSDNTESCITNPSYEDLQDNQRDTVRDNVEYEETENDVHTYDMADDPKRETTGEKDYSYAKFAEQPKFQDLTPILTKDRSLECTKDSQCYEPISEVKGDGGNAYFFAERDVTSPNGDYDRAKEVKNVLLAVNSNSTSVEENYFVIEKTGCNPVSTRNEGNDNYFVLDNDANERVEATVQQQQQQQQQHYLEDDDPEQEENGYGGKRKNVQKQRKTVGEIDPYDHVRVGHVQTNGIDDGVYDELRKQNVRYESEKVENDYDHC
ncbi:uncharacterized protein LOC110442866 [Mizuhopecten yessoensis]|uniref:Uncharacterized protein n=1 Tax=Mizuhopecten yessoensis TaxID=6573 RepID=A0A210PGE4_MIZYE|nr:uncharacterized protein LOC110442866 [Mizuhopecten yessoensis]OWF35516.1 hypothetical protein KP79_PYT11395 [Mizuhopecten yessoensis]